MCLQRDRFAEKG